MSSYFSISSEVSEARFGHAWVAGDGSRNATVRLGDSFITFDDPALARAAAAACTAAAEAIEALAEGGQS